ncbi:GNAT family N-acetyltransferase [Streptomyces sp. WMMB303]|uniref:GNAT family N-acetyltransferase n=1 Tax=Streptomyces sp. WMMB303 TaxID=3034154 RepID=UPI0023EAFBB9|nr:GNAT family N-acetyltransferase [Streptomyces sp. WMMB303]MDF4253654.1 GNAT family N-acetyltransferase [Streptomyces sp. WMMB303]
MTATYPLRTIAAHELDAWARMVTTTYGQDWQEGGLRNAASSLDPDRTIAAWDGGEIVGGASVYGRVMTVPGGAVPVAGITLVAVLPTHRRRGILTAMMREQLTGLHDTGGEPIAALNASEATIYSRFGYGLASRVAEIRADLRSMALRAETDLGDGTVRLLDRAEARPLLEKVYETVRGTAVGWVDRTEKYWQARLADGPYTRDGGTALRFAVHREPGGEPTGYALYRSKAGVARVLEVAAASRQSYAALWHFLVELDAHDGLVHDGAVDEPLEHLLTDPRAVRPTVTDNLWVRLVDIDRALTARRYATPLDVVLEVQDAFCPWNAGRHHLSADGDSVTCETTRARPDLRVTSAELGAAYLGGTTLSELAAAGRVEELRPGAVAAASLAFRGERAPFHPSGRAFPAF